MKNEQIEAEIYERQKGESKQAFEAFCYFRNLHPYERSVSRVQNDLNKSCKKWAREFVWSERVQEWDKKVDREVQANRIKEFIDNENKEIQILSRVHDFLGANFECLEDVFINGEDAELSPIISFSYLL